MNTTQESTTVFSIINNNISFKKEIKENIKHRIAEKLAAQILTEENFSNLKNEVLKELLYSTNNINFEQQTNVIINKTENVASDIYKKNETNSAILNKSEIITEDKVAQNSFAENSAIKSDSEIINNLFDVSPQTPLKEEVLNETPAEKLEKFTKNLFANKKYPTASFYTEGKPSNTTYEPYTASRTANERFCVNQHQLDLNYTTKIKCPDNLDINIYVKGVMSYLKNNNNLQSINYKIYKGKNEDNSVDTKIGLFNFLEDDNSHVDFKINFILNTNLLNGQKNFKAFDIDFNGMLVNSDILSHEFMIRISDIIFDLIKKDKIHCVKCLSNYASRNIKINTSHNKQHIEQLQNEFTNNQTVEIKKQKSTKKLKSLLNPKKGVSVSKKVVSKNGRKIK